MSTPCDGIAKEQLTVQPSAAGGWAAVAGAVARKAQSVAGESRWWHLVVEADLPGAPYVQLAVSRRRVLAEVRADERRTDGPRLDPRITDAMALGGWSPPVDLDSGRPHWWKQWDAPYDLNMICRELILWFSTGFNLPDDVSIAVEVFPGAPLHGDDEPDEADP